MIKDKLPVKLGATREVEREFLAELRGEKWTAMDAWQSPEGHKLLRDRVERFIRKPSSPSTDRYLIASRLDGSDTWDPHGLDWFDDKVEASCAMVSLSQQHPPIEFTLFKCSNVLSK